MTLNEIVSAVQPVLTHAAIGTALFAAATVADSKIKNTNYRAPENLDKRFYGIVAAGAIGAIAGPHLFGSAVADYFNDPTTLGGATLGIAGAAIVGGIAGFAGSAAAYMRNQGEDVLKESVGAGVTMMPLLYGMAMVAGR